MKALIFDLDGTLIDSVYTHVFAWQKAFGEFGLIVEGWKIHRQIGMGSRFFIRHLAKEIGHPVSDDEIKALQQKHSELFRKLLPQRQPLPGARRLIDHLAKNEITFGIATSGSRPTIDDSLNALQLPDTIPVSEGSQVDNAKPAPDLFLKCSQMLKIKPESCYVVGDSVWDILAAKRAKMTGIALLTGGYGKEELHHAGAVRVYKDPIELKNSLFELIS